jgi:membrane protein DedA with SNARE-associated domain
VFDSIFSVLSGDPANSEFLACVALFLGTFVQEGIAIAAGAALIVEHGLSPTSVAAALITGMVSGDLAIYSLGALARHHRWARRLSGHQAVAETATWLHRNLIGMVMLSRVVPGILFPTFIACGWTRVSFPRFACLSVTSAALYAMLWLTALTKFGEVAIPTFGHWAWTGAAVATLALMTIVTRLATRQLRASLRP